MKALNTVIMDMGTELSMKVKAVENLHTAALAASTANITVWPFCCDAAAFNEKYEPAYGYKVDVTSLCILGPCTRGLPTEDFNRTASMPTKLGGTPVCGNSVLGQEFLDATMKNTVDFPGTTWQYFGSETGLFTQFPGSGVPDYTVETRATGDTYDCRERPWYKQAKAFLGKPEEGYAHFSEPYLNWDGMTMMITASRTVTSADKIFQGVLGLDLEITQVLKPLESAPSNVDGNPVYFFTIDGVTNDVIGHPKLDEIKKYNTKHAIKYTDLETHEGIQAKIKEIIGKASGEFEISDVRRVSSKNSKADAEDADVKSAADFFSNSMMKQNFKIACKNLGASKASVKFTICAVQTSGNMQLHIVIPALVIFAIAGAAAMFVMKNGDGAQNVA